MLLPYPFENYASKLHRDNPDAAYLALVAKMNSIMLSWYNELMELYFAKMPERVSSDLLNELGYFLGAGFLPYDSEVTKRLKIKNAIATHKKRGLWTQNVKIKIDTITGYSSAIIYVPSTTEDWIEDDGIVSAGTYWNSEGVGFDSAYLGINEIGGYTDPEMRGNIYINCHVGINTPVLTSSQIAQIVDAIAEDDCPAYFAVYLSYINSSGQTIVYANGTID